MSLFLLRHIKKRLFPISPSSIKFQTNDKNQILKAFKERTWQETEEQDPWDILWADQKTIQEVLSQQILRENQRVNGFSNDSELTDEIKRLRNIKKYLMGMESPEKMKNNEEFSFGPRAYILPEDKEKFVENSLKEESGTWRIKSVKNVENRQEFFQNFLESLTSNPQKNLEMESFIVEECLKTPLKIGGKQPVLNIFCLVKSFLPLTAYLYRDAFLTLPSDPHHSQSISFNNMQIQIPNQPNSSYNGSVWSLRKFKTYLISKFGPKTVDNCFLNIQQLIIKTLEFVQKQIPKSRNSFALYNFQISLDSSLKPYLSNVHHNFPEDLLNNDDEVLQTKSNLIDDLLTIIDMEKILTGLEDQIGGFDLITLPSFQTNKPKTRPSKLGFINTRETQLNKLAKDAATRLLDAYVQRKSRHEPARLNLANNENNMSANSTGPITIISPLSPQGLLSPQGFLSPQDSDGRIIDLSPTKPESNISTRVFKLRRAPRHASDPNLSRQIQAAYTPESRLKRFISTGAHNGGDTTPNSSLPSIKLPSPGNSFVPFMTERIPQHKSTSNTPRNLRKTNKILPPILVNSEDKDRLNKSKFERLLEEAGYDFNKNPISLTEVATPSTATSLKEMIESQKMSELDEKVLKILHRRSGAKRVLKETQSFRVLKSTSAKLSKDEVKKILLKSKTSHYTEDLGEIKEEEEYIVKPSR